MTTRTTLAIVAALLSIGLGGCSRSADQEPAPVETSVDTSPPAEPVAEDTPEPLPSPSETPATNLAAAPPAVPPAPDEQMMDDASATGMTARAARDEVPGADAAPTEPVERK